jgi:hypothetical protein
MKEEENLLSKFILIYLLFGREGQERHEKSNSTTTFYIFIALCLAPRVCLLSRALPSLSKKERAR